MTIAPVSTAYGTTANVSFINKHKCKQWKEDTKNDG